MLDKAFGAVNKAKNADTVVFTLSRFEEFPDLWASDTTFKDMKKVSNVGVQQNAFAWGKSELIDYINADGKKLRAILTKPENFDPDEEVPADGLHLRGADAGASQLQPRRTSAPASTSRATSATATCCCVPTSSTPPGIRVKRPRSASSRR